MDPARSVARAAVRTALDRHVDEPTVQYHGRRYPESELRRLKEAGALDTLPPRLAAGIDLFLSGIDHGRKDLRIAIVGTGDGGWIGFMPLSAEYLLPIGWTFQTAAKAYLFAEPGDQDYWQPASDDEEDG